MKDAQLFEVEQAAPARVHFAFDRRIETAVFPPEAAERAHERHIADDVGHLAVNRRGLAGEVVMQWPAGRGQAKHHHHQRAGNEAEPTAIGTLTVKTSAIAATVAAHGGITFQKNIFSLVKTAFEVDVMRLVSVPGIRSAK